MLRRLATALLLLLLMAAGSGQLRAAPAETVDPVERSLALLKQVDLQALAPVERQQLLAGMADQLQAAGQPGRALDFLVRALDAAGNPPPPSLLAKIETLLAGLDRASLENAAFLYAGTPVAGLALRLLNGGAALPDVGPTAATPAVGVLLPLSGRYAPFGEAVRQGIELACATAAPAGQVRFVYRDSAAPGTDIARLTAELANEAGMLAVIGPLTSGEAAAAAGQADADQLPLLLLAPREGQTGSYVFRNALTPALQTRVLAEMAVRRQGVRNFLILFPVNRHGELYAASFQAAVEQYGGRVVARQGYPEGSLDLRKELEALARAARAGGGAEALFLPAELQQVAQILPQLAFPKLDGLQLFGIGTWNDPELVRLAGPQSEGAIFVDGFFVDSPWPQVREFVERFQALHDTPPNILNAQGYDAGHLLLTLLARPEVHDRATLRQALATLRGFPGVTGITSFPPDGEADKTLFLLQVQAGVVVQVE